MTDQPTTPTTAPEAETPKAVVRISTPDTWTLEHWQLYSGGQQEYSKLARARGWNPDGFSLRFYGTRALIAAGVVHMQCDDAELLAKLRVYIDSPAPPLGVVGLLLREVADVLEGAFEVPLV